MMPRSNRSAVNDVRGRTGWRSMPVILAMSVLIALGVSACGSSSSGSGGSKTPSSPTSVASTGPGLTSPTTGVGSKVPGGTVTFTEGSDAPPNYIFPMYTFAVCSTTNNNQLMYMMYQPLYTYGENYQPTIDYNHSIGQAPAISNGGKTFTIKLNPYKWSDGENVTARDLVFWMNVMKASPSTEWCGYAPGYFPDNVVSYSAPNPSTFTITFNKKYDPEWIIYSELSQLTPMPLAWDRTSLSQPAPKTDTGHLPDTSKSGAASIYAFLDKQSKDLASWPTSPLWTIVDGPMKLSAFNTDGEATFVPNPDFSGTPKPSIAKLVELPYTSEAAIYNSERSGGPSQITIGNVPSQYAPQLSQLGAEGYTINKAASYSFNYFPINLNSNATTSPGNEPIRYVFRQTYFRNALQHLVDQQGWIKAFLYDTAVPTCGPIPFAPPSSLVNTSAISSSPCSFSTSAASQLLSSHGWKVVPNGVTTCENPTLCGTGISKGEGISFNIDYESGVVAVQNEMNDLSSQAKKIGIAINLSTHPFSTTISTATPCPDTKPSCKWTAENWGAGWIYGPSYLPTGEPLYNPGSAANAGSYSDTQMTSLIGKTITGPLSQESAALASYASYAGQQDPVIFGPTSIGTFEGDAGTLIDKKLAGYSANALGWLQPQYWYFTK
jgi:peptide/nickel transport system substrate-binding protein